MLRCPILARKKMRVGLLSWLTVVTFGLAPSVAHARIVDLNQNGMSDVWERIYRANGVDPKARPSGDAASNFKKSIAGADPFVRDSFPAIPALQVSGTNISVTVPSQLGKRYQLQSTTAPGQTNWIVETSVEALSGTTVTLTAPMNAKAKFYRIAISDVYSDGSALSDWEKLKLGLDPLNAYSNARLDAHGNALSDYNYVTNALASDDVVTIAATIAGATEPDPGQPPLLPGQFTVTRTGLGLDSITVDLAQEGTGVGFGTAGVDFAPLPASVSFPTNVTSTTITLTPLSDTNLSAPVLAELQVLPGSGYTIGLESNASVVVYPSPTPTGAGLVGQYYTNSSSTYTNKANFNPTNLILTRVDPQVDFLWKNGMSPNLSNGFYTVRWTGQVQPPTSDTYFFDVASDDGCRLWVNDQLLIDKWQPQWDTDWTNAIFLQAGVRYDIRLDYLQVGSWAQAHLSWFNSTQSKQIIPTSALYPSNSFGAGSSNGPVVVTSPLNAVAFLGQPFSFVVTAANKPLGFTASGLPPGLSFNTSSGLISGVPTLAGNFQVMLTASNLVGVGASAVTIAVLDTGSSVVQEIWSNVPGIYITNIPTSLPASVTNILGALAGTVNYGNNYGERVRGYFTAPTTGNYYFWIAGSDSAQLWISDDNQEVNRVLRATVNPLPNRTKAGERGTTPNQWNLQPNQQSPWLSLVGGQQYYIEVLHKAGVGVGDNWSVGWSIDPTGTNNVPAGAVPSYLLSTYYPPSPANTPGTLYTANMLALPGVASDGVGSATLRVNAAGTQATLSYSFNNLTGTATGQAINSDPYEGDPSELIFDISAAKPQPNGTYIWNFTSTGPLTVPNIQEIINEGKAVIVIQSTAFPNGEIGGHFTLANGSQTFTPPPAAPVWVNDSSSSNAAVRFLNQATFGATASDIASVRALGYKGWLANQFARPTTHMMTGVLANQYKDPTQPFPSTVWFNTWWQNAVTAPDQLRQRVAFALSEIFVVSENGALSGHADALASYYDVLVNNAFGNFRNILEEVTLHPSMGMYLSMLGNNKGNIITGFHADENYAREIQQLFSIGLNREWPDGTLILNAQDSLIPTYNQNVIMGFASVFTGWNYHQTNQANGRLPSNWYPPYNDTNFMTLVPSHHELGAKLLLDNVVLPPAWGKQTVPSTNNDAYCSHDLEAALDVVFANQNVAPFICRELIQRLVTSNPSRDYVYRVAQVFNDDGKGVRGDMQAVVEAILLDYEARSSTMVSQPTYGKQREPLLRVTAEARAFPAPSPTSGTYSETTNQVITITTASPHRLNSGDTTMLKFTDASGHAAPITQAYTVTQTGPKTFTVNAPQLSTGKYNQTNGTITVNISNHGLAVGDPVHLTFTTGGAASGQYQVVTVADASHFTVANGDMTGRAGSVLMPLLSVAGFNQVGTTVTVITFGPHGLKPGNQVFVEFPSGTGVTGTYTVAATPSPTLFTVTAAKALNQTSDGLAVYPLIAPPLTRHGSVTVGYETWNMGYTDTGSSTSLPQSPLRSPTVFNYFYPGYEFPGILASAGLTTPEFQLTSASSVGQEMNFIESSVLNNTANTNGLSSFASGNGSIYLDIGPWMNPKLTADSGIPTLVGALNTRLMAGQLSADVEASVVGYVANTNNFPYTEPKPTAMQMRDRVRAVIHLLTASPDFIIQK